MKKNKPGSWKRYRKRFVAVERYDGVLKCEYCEEEIDTNVSPPKANALTVDHVVPLSKGGKLKCRDNLVICCYLCNMKKGDKQTESLEN